MKKFLGICAIALVCVLCSVITTVCTLKYAPDILPATAVQDDGTYIEECVQNIVNPVFTSLDDILYTQQSMRSNATTDSVFLSLSEPVLRNVASVALKKSPFLTKTEIVGEFLSNRQIYENLPPTQTSNVKSTQEDPMATMHIVTEGTTTVTEAPPTRAVPPNYKDTTIEGKHALIQIH